MSIFFRVGTIRLWSDSTTLLKALRQRQGCQGSTASSPSSSNSLALSMVARRSPERFLIGNWWWNMVKLDDNWVFNSGEIAVTSSKTGCKCNVMEIISPWSLIGHGFPVSISFNHLERTGLIIHQCHQCFFAAINAVIRDLRSTTSSIIFIQCAENRIRWTSWTRIWRCQRIWVPNSWMVYNS